MLPAFKPLPKVHDCTLLAPRKGAHRILSDAWQKLPLVDSGPRLPHYCFAQISRVLAQTLRHAGLIQRMYFRR